MALETNAPRMAVGDKFQSWDNFEKSLAQYEQATKQKFWIRSSRKLETVNVNRTIKKELKYYNAQYFCVHGGLHFKSRGKGQRQSRYKIGFFFSNNIYI